MTNITAQKKEPPTNIKRGRVVGFSAASRRRMINFISRFDLRAIRTVFLTLTFKAIPSYSEAKRAFKQFTMRLRRDNPNTSAVWRVELQLRGAVHYHLMLFNFPFTAHSKLLESWRECTADNAGGVNIKLCRNHGHVMAYVSKYCAKFDKREATLLVKAAYQHKYLDQYEGRHWGWINKEKLPFGSLTFAVMSDEDEIKFFVWSHWANKKGRYPVSWSHATLYLKDATDYALNAHRRDVCDIIHRARGEIATLEYRKSVYAKLRDAVDEIS